jgi:hypothetical protein
MPLKLIALTGLLLASQALAQARPDLVLPPASRLQLLPGTGIDGPAAFSGTTIIHAILVAQWVPNANGDGLPGATFHLLPVPQSALQIPHLQGAPMRFLAIADGQRLLARATHDDIAAEFASRRLGVVHIEGLFSITGLRVGTPCATAGEAQIVEVDPIRVRFPFQPAPLACPN